MKIDGETLAAFTAEARGYLPRILDGLEAGRRGPQAGGLTEAHRLLHSIKGASAMVGLAPLSLVASLAERSLDEVMAGERPLDGPLTETLAGTVEAIDAYLDGFESPDFEGEEILLEVVGAFRRLAGLPEAGDPAEVERLLGGAPAPAPPAPLRDDVAEDLVTTFRQEAGEHLGLVSQRLGELADRPGDREAMLEIRRSVHTLKGSSSLVGFADLGRLAHRMEDLLDLLYGERQAVTPGVLSLLHATTDAMEDLSESPPGVPGDSVRVGELLARYDGLLSPYEPVNDGAGAVSPPREELLPPADGRPAARTASDRPLVRVQIDRLDELVRLAGELVVHRAVFERQQSELTRQLEDLGTSIGRLQRLGGRLEVDSELQLPAGVAPAGGGPTPASGGFDALELDRYSQIHLLSRELTEAVADLGAIGAELDVLQGDLDAYGLRLGRLTSEVQGRLMGLRMLPLASLAPRLARAVRTTAEKRGRQVAFRVEGEGVELDKSVLEAVADPLLHLLRNAVDHGIEPADRRRERGKPHAGQVTLRAFNEGTRIVLQIEDDGAGMDPDRLVRAAVAAGHLEESEAAGLALPDRLALAFLAGISTAPGISDISGRGVGLDIVKAAVAELKGTVEVDSRFGRGTVFTIRLPMTLAVTRVLLVTAHGETYALPLAAVVQILRAEPGDIERLGGEPVLRLGGRILPVRSLGGLLSPAGETRETTARPPLVVLRLADREVAFSVDRILAAREVVVKPLGPLLRRVPGIAGATFSGDGRVVLILDPAELPAMAGMPAPLRREGPPPRPLAIDVLLVDDSLSVRRVLENLARGAGWNPIPAKDGIDALETLERLDRRPDAILLDLEMPRMDGYELMATLRSQQDYSGIPIVILTSRAGEKHRRRALELGATEYLVKPYAEEELKAAVSRVVAEARRGGPGSHV